MRQVQYSIDIVRIFTMTILCCRVFQWQDQEEGGRPRALGLFDLMHVFARAKLLNWVRLFLYCEALLMDIWAYIHNHG